MIDYDLLILFLHQLLCLVDNLNGLIAVYAITIGLDAENGRKLMPVYILKGKLVGICDGIAEEGDSRPVPLALDFRLGTGGLFGFLRVRIRPKKAEQRNG